MRRLSTAILTSLATVLLAVSTALAVDPPDSLTFEAASSASAPAITVYRDLLEQGDMLVVGQYNITYQTLPDDNADINFIGRVYHGTTAIGANVPYPYNDGGYGKGVISWYLSEDETADEGWTDGAGNWDEWGSTLTDLNISLDTNPTLFDAEDQKTAPANVPTNGFSSGSGQATNQDQLAAKVIAIGRGLEAAWGVSMIDTNGRLNSSVGGPYMQLAIPGILSMAPDAFGSSSVSPTIPTPMPTPGGSGTFAETAANRLDGAWWLTPQFDLVSGLLGLPVGSFESFASVMLIFGCAAIGARREGGFDASGATFGLLLGAGTILPFFTALGILSFAMGGFGIFCLAMGAGFKIAKDHLL